MLRSIASSGACVAAKPTNIVPCPVTVPYGMLRRKMWPKSSWSVRATCESSGRGSSSTLSSFVRPMTASCPATGSDSQVGGQVLPLLQQQDRPARAAVTLRHEHGRRRVDERRVLAAVDEAGQVAVVLVRPAGRLLGDG